MTIERAAIDPGIGLRERFASLPTNIRAGINRARHRRGLAPIDAVAAPPALPPAPAEPLVFWDPDSKHPLRERFGGRWERGVQLVEVKITRVVIACCPGRAQAASRDHGLPEIVARDAFGPAESLNAAPGWTLRAGHEGPTLEIARPDRAALRAIDSEAGLLVEWIPDLARADHRDAIARIEAGHNAVSVRRLDHDLRTMNLPTPTAVAVRSRLLHVALLPPGRTGAYPAARATVFRDCPKGEAERRRQIAQVVKWARRAGERTHAR